MVDFCRPGHMCQKRKHSKVNHLQEVCPGDKNTVVKYVAET